MKIIPVIDLMNGQAVHARTGQRSAYRPLVSRLCDAADQPLQLITALLTWFPFRQVYIADLDAILGTGANATLVRRIKRRFPGLRLWMDEGIRQRDALLRSCAEGFATPVIGSETLTDLEVLTSFATSPHECTPVLSLDYLGERFLGPPRLERDHSLWPREVILMTLARVGSDLGPDFASLRHILRQSPQTELYAAGGVRGAEDLNRLHALGVAGVLVASALHDERLNADELAGYD